MEKLFTPQLWEELFLRRQKGKKLLGLVAAVTLAAVAAVLATGFTQLWKAGVLAAITAAGGIVGYVLLQKRLIPLKKAMVLTEELAEQEGEEITGTYLGYNEAMGFQEGLLTRRIRIDSGQWIRRERVIHEVNYPAYYTEPDYEPGSQVTIRAKRNMVLSCQKPRENWKPEMSVKRVGYRIAPLTIFCILLGSVLLWMTAHTLINREKPEEVVSFAVCSDSYNNINTQPLADAMAEEGIKRVHISYMTTGDIEQAAYYLATYGALEADVLLMYDYMFEGAFAREGHILSQEDRQWLEEMAGRELTYAEDAAGNAVGVILRPWPEGEAAAGLDRWLLLEETDPYVAVININSIHGESGTAVKTLGLLLRGLAEAPLVEEE